MFFVVVLTMMLVGGCMDNGGEVETPPEREFDQSTAWSRMEEAVAEAIDGVPDFPGFEERRLLELACTHNGAADEEYTKLELTYVFSAEDSAANLVREEYVELLRSRWVEAGYDVHRDESYGKDPIFHEVEATRPDGINYWLVAANYVSLKVQSGCVKKASSDECPPPLGNVPPDNDLAGRQNCARNYDEPAEETK